MRRRPQRHPFAPLALTASVALSLTACAGASDPPPADAPPPAAEAPNDPGAGADAGSGGAAGDCAAAPTANEPGAYPAENLPAVQARTDELVSVFDAADGRYCIDAAGDITYFLLFDFAEDGFHSLEVCGSVFTYFEGDFEGAAVVYSDATVRCG